MLRAARLWFLVPLVGLAACGGRYSSTRHDEPIGSAGNVSGAAGNGNVSTAGTGSAGTSPTCQCDPIACASGYAPVANDNGCCFHCELDQDACEEQHAEYLDYRGELIAQFFSYACMQDTDCVAFYIQNNCDDSCLLTVTAARRAVIDGLNNYATSNCDGACFQDPKPNCGTPPPVRCVGSRCTTAK